MAGLVPVMGMMGPKNQVEESLLLACSNSDVPAINKAISKKYVINFQCVDILGRTPLQLAIENEDIEVTKLLLPYCDNNNIENCLLFAISLSNENLAMAILRHPRYLEIEKDNMLNPDNSFDSLPSNSKFPTNTTPLVLAADKNLYEVVRYLLVEGKTISVPHSLVCSCSTCSKKSHIDHFRFAHERLNAYRGLASESYISLSSSDPILQAFQLRRTLLKLAETEEHFKAEYTDLAKNISAFSVKLLNKVIGDRELDAVLNKVGGSDEDHYVQLGRLKLAVKLQEKRFVAHPSCQMRLKKLWYEDFEIINRGHILRRFAIGCVFCLCYVFLALVYLVAPRLKALRFMRSPCAKFLANVLFYLILLAMLLWSTIQTLPYRTEADITWTSVNTTKYFRIDTDGALLFRNGQTVTVHYLIFIWVVGLLWQEIKEFYRDGWREYFSSILNLLDLVMLCLYFASYGARFYSIGQVKNSSYYFKEGYLSQVNSTIYQSPIELLDAEDETALQHYSWVNPDRYYWDQYDSIIICEGLFAIANVLDFARFAALLPAFEALGTLQISFGIMIKDILRFLGLFGLVFLAFMVGLANLYWFYGESTRQSVELETHPATVAEAYFGDITSAFKYCFWSLFGMGERDAFEIDTFKDFPFTQTIGLIMYGIFLITCVIVLLNMLIAMMSLSFSQIQDDADVEWKFSRTQLFFDYMTPGTTLPVPLNIIPTPKSVFYMFRSLSRCCCKRENKTNDVKAASEKHTSSSTDLIIMDADETKVNDRVETETATSDPTFKSDMPLDHPDLFKYKSVISRLVRRFISDSTSSQDDNNDDENLKTDLIRIRREMANALDMRGREIEHCRQDVVTGRSSVQKDIMDCKKAVDNLHTSVQLLTTIITQMKAGMNQSSPVVQNNSSPVGQDKPAPLERISTEMIRRQTSAFFKEQSRVGTPAPVLPSQSNTSPSLAALIPSSVSTTAKYSAPSNA